MESNVQNNKTASGKNTRSKQEIALDKFDVDINAGRKSHKKKPKQNPVKQFFAAVFPQKTDSAGDVARKLLLLVAVCILIGTLAYLVYQLKGMKKGQEVAHEIAVIAGAVTSDDEYNSIVYSEPDRLTNPTIVIPDAPGTEEPEYINTTPLKNVVPEVDFTTLKSLNPDVRAWIKIQGTLINNVVMQDPTGGDYYINHDFYGNESISGEVFSSSYNRWDGTDDNIILFGHNMRSGYYFAYVNHYVPYDGSTEPLAFYKVHPTIMLRTPGNGFATYKIFAGFIANTDPNYGEVFNYTGRTSFGSASDFNRFILDVMDRSWFYTDVDITYGDQLLTLSTCFWPLGRNIETRWVIVARKVRPGESEEVDTSVATRNYGAKLFDFWYQVCGGQWYGSNWDTSKLLSL